MDWTGLDGIVCLFVWNTPDGLSSFLYAEHAVECHAAVDVGCEPQNWKGMTRLKIASVLLLALCVLVFSSPPEAKLTFFFAEDYSTTPTPTQ
jgi:hypothetical protein